LALSLLAVGCAPKTNDLGTISQDMAATSRDMAINCTAAVGNYLLNPDFETPASGASQNGTASNVAATASTIPSWTGCCGTSTTTTYTIQTTSPHCGSRAVKVASAGANADVLLQVPTLTGKGGQTFHLSGAVWVQPQTNGGTLQLDVFDLTAKAIVASSVVLNAATADWFTITPVVGTLPAAANVQVRINTTGNITALVDDLALTVP
jgi:hypothetical protein